MYLLPYRLLMSISYSSVLMLNFNDVSYSIFSKIKSLKIERSPKSLGVAP
jgi:hypothetical protein